jgi:hypothetical protein
MTRRQIVLCGLAALLVVMDTTCGGGPSSPSDPPPYVTDLALAGPAALTAVGQTAQLTATATLSDGTVQDVTSSTTWSSSDPDVLTVGDTGVMTAVAFGLARIGAIHRGQEASLDARALPGGTFVLNGTVSEPVDLPIDNAKIEVNGGQSVGSRTEFTTDGFYQFVGVGGAITLKASRSGYVTEQRSVDMSRDRTVNLSLDPVTPPARVRGRYRLTVTASRSCRAALPAEARVRTYVADITQKGAAVEVTLSGADFAQVGDCEVPPNRFSGIISGDNVSFDLRVDDPYGYYYRACFRVAERLSEPTMLGIGGRVEAVASGSGISGELSGELVTFPGATGAVCSAGNHRFSFAR